MKRDFKKEREATARAMKMETKACFDINMKNGNWNFPCCSGIKKYVVIEESAAQNIERLDTFFDETDKALSVSIKHFYSLCLVDVMIIFRKRMFQVYFFG